MAKIGKSKWKKITFASMAIFVFSVCLLYNINSNKKTLFQSLGNEAFFMETSRSPSLNYRQACSVESLALANPSLKINVLMTALNSSSPVITILRNYPNVNVLEIEPGDLFLGTPLEHWYFSTDWRTGPYVIEHLSDALRYTVLYLYGGYYFDLDIVTMHPVTSYRNFSAAESESYVAIGAMHFDYKHPVIVDLVEEFRASYNKTLWGQAGPEAITRVLKRYCHVQYIRDATVDGVKPCANFTILTPSSFYPISFGDWEAYFRKGSDTERILNDFEQRKVIGAHVWNKITAKAAIFKDAGQLYDDLARRFCPLIYSAASNPF